MKVLIIYDSVSPKKNTEQIANALGEVLKSRNFDTTINQVGSVNRDLVKEYDCVLVGSPTIAWSPTKPIKEFLESLNDNEFAGKSAVAFDTRIKSRLSGQATKGIEERLKKSGFKIVASPLVAYVEGVQRTNDYSLKEGELEKAKKYAEDLAKALQQ